jgi:hypothetical protein
VGAALRRTRPLVDRSSRFGEGHRTVTQHLTVFRGNFISGKKRLMFLGSSRFCSLNLLKLVRVFVQ